MWPIRDSLNNLRASPRSSVSYITEPANWVTRTVGASLAQALAENHDLNVHVTSSTLGLRRRLIHFGSLPAFLHGRLRPSHRGLILTVYHLSPEFRQHSQLKVAAAQLSLIHTTNTRTQLDLLQLGLPPEKIRVIPLGVDEGLFVPASPEEREQMRTRLKIPPDAFVIGSFQKDGIGWQSGQQPKLIKGPDLLCDVVNELARDFPIFVLLAGPARGYVIRRLQQQNIKFRYAGYLPAPSQVAPYFRVLDAYLITSRLEGGPQQLLEAWASGVPVVSTAVGMVPDIARHNYDVLLAPLDARLLASQTARLIDEPGLRDKLRTSALQTVENFSWRSVARRYLAELYQPLL